MARRRGRSGVSRGEELRRAVLGAVGTAGRDQDDSVEGGARTRWRCGRFPREQARSGRCAESEAAARVGRAIMVAAVATVRPVVARVGQEGRLGRSQATMHEHQT